MVAIAQNGMALRYVSEALRQELEVVQVAVGQNGEALEFASPELQA